MAGIDHYTVLDVKPDATPEEIKKAYRAMAIKTHPDRGGVTHLFRMVQEAYETLSDPSKRAAYDRETAEPAPRREEPQWHDPDEEYSYAYSEPVRPAEPPAPRTRRQKIIVAVKGTIVAAPLLWVVGSWVVAVVGLWQLVQPNTGLHLVVFQGLPALVYIVLWLFSTLISAVSEEPGPAIAAPIIAAVITSVFAFITAVGTEGAWTPTLAAGFVATAVVALAIRFREGIIGWCTRA